jgi:hypothetical protein
MNMLTTSVVIGHVIVDNELEIKNDVGNPVPVSGTLAAALTDAAPVAVTDVAGVLLAASAGRRSFRARNVGVNAVAIGGAGVTFAAAAIVLQPGELWIETDAPGAAWKCICDATLASTLNVLTAA